MNKNVLLSICVLLLLAPAVFSYQQGNLIFELNDKWEVRDARTTVQGFTNGDMYIEVRKSSGLMSADEFAFHFEGVVESTELINNINQSIVTTEDKVYILSSGEYQDKIYSITGVAPLDQKEAIKEEMSTLYSTVEWSSTEKYVKAPWQEEYVTVEPLGYLEKNPINWSRIIFYAVIILILFLIVRWWMKRKKKKSEGKEKKTKSK